MKNKKNIFKYAFLAYFVVFIVSLLIVWFLYDARRKEIYETKEEVTINTANSLERYIVDTYDLYFDSGTLKFKEIIEKINRMNSDSSGFFQLISVRGDILLDSRNIDPKQQKFEKSEVGLSILQGNDVYVHKRDGRVEYVVVPSIDDWGNHRYSVKFNTNYSDVDQKIGQYQLFMIVLALAINGLIVFSIILFLLSQRYQLAKERSTELEEINKLKDEFMIIVAHNLRTPLTLIKGYSSIISESKIKDKELAKNLSGMNGGVDRLSVLVEDIILATALISGKEEFHKEEFSLSEIVDGIREEKAKAIEEKNVTFRFSKNGSDKFLGDKEKIKVVLENLVDNAIKFNKERGTVDLKIENFSDLRIIVTDTGIGVSESKTKEMINLFHRGGEILEYNFEGAGMGLYLTNLIVKHYNGQINIKSEPDKGSSFEVILKND